MTASDDEESDRSEKGSSGAGDDMLQGEPKAAKAVGATTQGAGAIAEAVGAAKGVVESGEGDGGKTGGLEAEAQYPDRNRRAPGKYWVSETGWVTLKAKKRAGRSG